MFSILLALVSQTSNTTPAASFQSFQTPAGSAPESQPTCQSSSSLPPSPSSHQRSRWRLQRPRFSPPKAASRRRPNRGWRYARTLWTRTQKAVCAQQWPPLSVPPPTERHPVLSVCRHRQKGHPKPAGAGGAGDVQPGVVSGERVWRGGRLHGHLSLGRPSSN